MKAENCDFCMRQNKPKGTDAYIEEVNMVIAMRKGLKPKDFCTYYAKKSEVKIVSPNSIVENFAKMPTFY